MFLLTDTIAAISTPLGESGIGIVRISGKDAITVARKVFVPARVEKWWDDPGYRLFYGYVVEPGSKEVIDEVLMGVMIAPYSYTKEDVVEFNCHGGIIPLRRTLETVLRQGARLAEPGEFSRRAFLNGRLDLVQAEAIIDIVRAKTDTGLKLAVSQLKGDFSGEIGEMQKRVAGLLAALEAGIDFPEDALELVSRDEMKSTVEQLLGKVNTLIESANKGKIYREGIWVVIAGRPNVGKSSLLNALLKEKRAIVTEIPGTTRDFIEEAINIKGIPVKLADTAGLRRTENPVEILGVQKSKELVKMADLVLLLLDAVEGVKKEDREILQDLEGKRKILLVNKVDLADGKKTVRQAKSVAGKNPVLTISALTGEGLEQLEEVIEKMIFGGIAQSAGNFMVSNVRHRDILRRAGDHLKEALEGIDANVSEDLLAIDIRAAWEILGEITGSTATEEIIDRIFADFCVGK
jgi:tRNA modification GTPase